MTDVSRRAHIEGQLDRLLDVSSPDDAYDIIDGTLTPPAITDGEAFATWDYHAERTRRQMIGAVLGELTANVTVERMSDHLDAHDSLVIPSNAPHPVRSGSLQDFVSTMNHWFSNVLVEVTQTNSTARALVEAGNRRRPLFRQAVVNWLAYKRAKDPDFQWELPSLEADTGEDIATAYSLNMANEVPNQLLIFGLDPSGQGIAPAELAHQRVPGFSKFTSTVHEISAPVMGPFVSYDPETGVNTNQRGKDTPQTLYSAWERDPTPANAQAFLALAQDSIVAANLEKVDTLPGAGEDGRSRHPGHCHIDMRIVREEAFAVSPRELLRRLGESSLAETGYLNMATLVSAVGVNAATHTLYKHWPGNEAS